MSSVYTPNVNPDGGDFSCEKCDERFTYEPYTSEDLSNVPTYDYLCQGCYEELERKSEEIENDL